MSILKTIRYKWDMFWLWQGAMSDAADHAIAGHNVKWEWNDVFAGHGPCIYCDECPDTHIEDGKHVGLALWCHWSMTRMWIGQRICGLLGHPLFQHPKIGGDYVEDEVYCYRCGQESKLRKVWLEDEGQAEALGAAPASGEGPDQVH